jgi:hypothetical protein
VTSRSYAARPLLLTVSGPQAALETCQVRLAKSDKKAARQLQFREQQELLARLRCTASSTDVFTLTVASLFQQVSADSTRPVLSTSINPVLVFPHRNLLVFFLTHPCSPSSPRLASVACGS